MATEISERIAFNLHKLKEKSGFSWSGIASGTGIVPKRLENCLSGYSEFKASEVVEIAKFFGKSTDYLYRGTDEKNCVVSENLGLTNESINFLAELARTKDDSPIPLDWNEKLTQEDREIFIDRNHDDLFSAGLACYPSDMLSIVNVLLTTYSGRLLLSAINSYVTAQWEDAWVSAYINGKETPVPVDLIHYKTTGKHGIGVEPTQLMLTSLGELVNDALHRVRRDINPISKDALELFERLNKGDQL